MIEKQQKRSKFSYFGEQTRKQKLLKDYQSLRQSPCIKRQLNKQTNKKYQYDQTSHQKQNLHKIISFSNLANPPKQSKPTKASPQKSFPKAPFAPSTSPLQFSPYQQNPNLSQTSLSHQYQQQFKLLKYQLKEFQYQNQLLKKKIMFIQDQCLSHRQVRRETEGRLVEMELQVRQLEAIKQDYQIQRMDYDVLLGNMKEEIHLLLNRNQQLQQLLQSKDHQILKLKTNIQVTQVTYNNNRRRKSLDLSIEGRARNKIQHPNQDYPNHLNYHENHYEQQKKERKQDSLKKRSLHIGKLLNKTSCFIPKPSQQAQLQSTPSKRQNLLLSIQSMFLKINKHPAQDLKQLWKWLKNIAYQNQSIKILKEMKSSLILVVEDFQQRNDVGFVDREWLGLAQRMLKVIQGWEANQGNK